MYDQLVMLISNVGFPIAVSLYLLLRIEKKLEELTKALNSLDKSILSAIEHQKMSISLESEILTFLSANI